MTVEIPGLDSEVEVVRDEHGIPQIYADSTHDLMLAQGYVHAQERFYEMDVRRHATAGRLAEMFGEEALETDMYVRTMGWRNVAERELPLLQPDTRAALDAYADGVNAYLADRSPSEISLEYTVLNAGGLDYHPADWTAVDSLAWLKAMAWDLRGNMQDEIDRVLSADVVGKKRSAALFPPYPYDEHDPIVRSGRRRRRGLRAGRRDRRHPQPAAPAVRPQGTGRAVHGPGGPQPDARLARQGRRRGQQLLGGRRRALHHRRADPGQRPAPRRLDAGRVDAGGSALPRRSPTRARSTWPASASPACPA